MADYSISFARSARKELERFPGALADRILTKIETLAKNPRPAGVIKLQGQTNLWRMRVGDYRVVYSIEDDAVKIEILIIRHRRDVYRGI
jgi:mRNA interferase RelE/StbE